MVLANAYILFIRMLIRGSCNINYYVNFINFQEKLFLTESNVESAIEEMESFPDPWVSVL